MQHNGEKTATDRKFCRDSAVSTTLVSPGLAAFVLKFSEFAQTGKLNRMFRDSIERAWNAVCQLKTVARLLIIGVQQKLVPS
jgi:hypothetical protein